MGVYFQYQQRADPIQFGTTAVPTQFEPEYPDWLAQPLRAIASFAPAFFFVALVAAPTVTPLSWSPTFPDQAPAARRSATLLTEYARPVIFEFNIARRLPTYPDLVIRRGGLHPSLLPAVVDASDYLFDPGQRVDPVYPDRASGPNGLHASRQQALARDPFVVDVAALSWSPVYPDRALGPLGLGVAHQQAVARDPFVVDVVGLSWSPTYPNRLDRTRTTHPDAAVLDPFPRPDTPPLATYPNLIPRRTLLATGMVALDPFPRPDTAPLSWSPAYPDSARPTPRSPVFPAFALDPFPRPFTRVDWIPVAPTWVLRRQYQADAAWMPAYSAPVAPPVAPLLSWGPSYPDRALGRPGLRPWLHQAFAHNLPPIAPPPVLPLSWKAVYPDRIFAHRVLAARIPFFSYVTSFVPAGTGALTLVDWSSGDTLVAIEIEEITFVPFSAP